MVFGAWLGQTPPKIEIDLSLTVSLNWVFVSATVWYAFLL
jgi:hypothetical protein